MDRLDQKNLNFGCLCNMEKSDWIGSGVFLVSPILSLQLEPTARGLSDLVLFEMISIFRIPNKNLHIGSNTHDKTSDAPAKVSCATYNPYNTFGMPKTNTIFLSS